MQKKLLLLLVITLLLGGITGCAIYRRPAPNPPTMPAPTPQTTPNMPAQQSAADQVMNLVNNVAGVKGSYAVVLGNMAMVGVDLRDRLNAQQENDLKTKIADEVKRQMPNLQDVWVSADPDLVVRIRDLATKIGQGQPVSGMMDEVNALLQKLRPQAAK